MAQLRDAKRSIGCALAGYPPDDIADELRDLLLEEIYSQRQAISHTNLISKHYTYKTPPPAAPPLTKGRLGGVVL